MTRARKTTREPVDWASVRERLERAQTAMLSSLEISPEREREVMEARARALSRAPATVDTGEALEVLAFELGAERYLIEAKYAREVIRLVDFTPVPGAGDFIVGVTNLRGEIVCVVDLRKLFNLAHHGLHDLSRLIAVGTKTTELGILVDQVLDVSVLRTRDILPVAELVASASRDYFVGVTRDAAIVLDGAALLRDPRLYIEHGEARGA